MTRRIGTPATLLVAALALAACDDDDPVLEPPVTRTFEVTVENVSMAYAIPASGVFDTPRDAAGPGPLMPGGVYEFSFHAAPGQSLSFATMFAQSNDLFYAPDGDGIALWDGNGQQVSGDVTDQVLLWDAGTEVNQEPGIGPDQAPRQSGADTGAPDDDPAVRIAEDEHGIIPPADEVLRVTLEPTGPNSFRARIENVGDGMTLMTSDGGAHPVLLSPGVFVVHAGADPLFTAGEADRGEGLERIAEDGAAGELGQALEDRTGITGVLSPGAWAVHRDPSVLFAAGTADRGEGLEAIAEDGDPSAMAASLAARTGVTAAGAFTTPVGAAGPGPLMPGGSYTFTFEAEEGARLSLATMYVQSNDLFFAPAETGLDLFPGGTALSGDVTGMFLLWDAGTEVNQAPGFGADQAPRQSGPDTGADEGGVVRQVNDGYVYPEVSEVLEVTIRVVG